MYISENTLDDLLRRVFESLLKSKNRIDPSKGKAREEFGVLLELSNPMARLSQTETRSTLFSCLGELLWYLSGTDSLDFIEYYIPRYRDFSDNGDTLYGAYGPRIFNMRGINQYNELKKVLLKQDTRQAVIQIVNSEDISIKTKDMPCTSTIQFAIRGGQLHMLTNMRSNDAYLGLPHDFFSFTMLQEILARDLSVDLGTYKHAVGSLHLYDIDEENAFRYLSEGWQSTIPMPPMPTEKLWPSIKSLLNAESTIRNGANFDLGELIIDPYWADIIRVLQIYAHLINRNMREIVGLKNDMHSRVFESHIRRKEMRPPPPPKQGRLAL